MNRSIFPEVYPPRANLCPLLVFNSFDDDNINNTVFNFVDPMHNDKYSMKKDLHSELLAGASIRFSKYGWLLLISKDMKTPFFYNPFTNVIIRLPFPDPGHKLFLSGMSFSSSPTSPHCVVFAIQPGKDNRISIYAIKRGSCDWKYLVLHNCDDSFVPCLNNPVFFRTGFFCLDYSGTLGCCVANDDDKNNNGLDWAVYGDPIKQFDDAFPSYLVECDGDLLLLNVGTIGETVGVFRLDWTNEVWVKVESLGKHMLFISNTSSFSAIAPPNSQMENKVNFPRLHKDGRSVLFYSLDTGRYHYSIRTRAQQNSVDAATNFYYTKEMCNCTWIEPDWSQMSTPTDEDGVGWLS